MRNYAVLLLILLVAGCANTAVPFDVDGSKADGTILFVASGDANTQVDWNAAQQNAKDRCLAWGYSDVEAFGGWRSRCLQMGPFGGCASMEFERKYQCIE